MRYSYGTSLAMLSALKGIESFAQEMVLDCCAEIEEGANSPDVHGALRTWQAVLDAIKQAESN